MTEDEAFTALSLNTGMELIFESVSDERWINYRCRYNTGRRSKIMHDFFPVNPKSAEATRYLLSRGFDLFGLIDAELAINKPLQSHP